MSAGRHHASRIFHVSGVGQQKIKIFIVGATGVIGKRVIPQLLAMGYEVVGLSRSEEHDEWLTSHGVVPRRGGCSTAKDYSE